MRCQDDLSPLSLERAGVWRCPNCDGHLLNQSAFEAFDPALRKLLRPDPTVRRLRACPRCERNMASLRFEGIVAGVDWCRDCKCAWVEKPDRELLEAIKARRSRDAARPDATGPSFMGEVVGEMVEDLAVEVVWETFTSWWD